MLYSARLPHCRAPGAAQHELFSAFTHVFDALWRMMLPQTRGLAPSKAPGLRQQHSQELMLQPRPGHDNQATDQWESV